MINAELTAELNWTEKELERDLKSEKRFEKKKKKELLKSEKRRRKLELKKIKAENRPEPWSRLEKFTTTKFLMYFILLNCTVVEIYSMVSMYNLQDLSSLYSLIGAVIGESITFAIYCVKSFKETKEEANHQLEVDRFNREFSMAPDTSLIEDDSFEPIIDPIPDDDDHSGDIPYGVIMEEPNC